jgi:hypothetical protein
MKPGEYFLAPIPTALNTTVVVRGLDIEEEGQRPSVDGPICCRRWGHAFLNFVPNTINQSTLETRLYSLSHPDPLSSEDGSSVFFRNGAIHWQNHVA